MLFKVLLFLYRPLITGTTVIIANKHVKDSKKPMLKNDNGD